jgi:hypothetical protein
VRGLRAAGVGGEQLEALLRVLRRPVRHDAVGVGLEAGRQRLVRAGVDVEGGPRPVEAVGAGSERDRALEVGAGLVPEVEQALLRIPPDARAAGAADDARRAFERGLGAENGVAVVFLRQVVPVQQVGLLDQEVVHEQLASDVDADDLRRVLEVGHGHGLVRLGVDVLGRPELRQHDAVGEALAGVLRPRLLRDGLGRGPGETQQDAPFAELQRLARSERLAVDLHALVGVGAEELKRVWLGDALKPVEREAGRERGGARHVGRSQRREGPGRGAAHAHAFDAGAQKGLALKLRGQGRERVGPVREESRARLENSGFARGATAQQHVESGPAGTGGAGRKGGQRQKSGNVRVHGGTSYFSGGSLAAM